MNRIPLIAASIALIALLVAGFLAMTSRIARLEEALDDAPRAQAGGSDPTGEFSALGYDGSSALHLRLSRRLAAANAHAPVTAAPADSAIEAGKRAALSTRADAALARLGRPGGYARDPESAIPLPQRLEAVRLALQGVGMDALMDDLRLRLNRAAELAAADARAPMMQAIAALPLDDAALAGHDGDSIADYFRSRMEGRLARDLRPLMAKRLSQVGAYGLYEEALGVYNSLPFSRPIEGDLTNYATLRGLDAIFHALSVEEQRIARR